MIEEDEEEREQRVTAGLKVEDEKVSERRQKTKFEAELGVKSEAKSRSCERDSKRATRGRRSPESCFLFISDWRLNKTVQTKREGEQRGGRQMGGWNTNRKKNNRTRGTKNELKQRAKRERTERKTAAAEGVDKQTVWSRLMSRHKTDWQSEDGN